MVSIEKVKEGNLIKGSGCESMIGTGLVGMEVWWRNIGEVVRESQNEEDHIMVIKMRGEVEN